MSRLRLLRSEAGKYALEATLLFPAILAVTFFFVFAGLTAGMDHAALSAAGLAAERAAFTWDNSHRNPVTGAFYPGQYDDLYWRLTQDFPSSSLAERKVSAALASVKPDTEKEARYVNALWRRKVAAETRIPLFVPAWLADERSRSQAVRQGEAIVTDPAEWVRTVSTVKWYWPQIRSAVTPEQAERIAEEFARRPGAEREPLAFDNHGQAVDYLRHLTGGREKRINTEEVGDHRKIESFDRNGIGHHAYLGKKTVRDVREQFLKDEELLKKGLVKGAVWHFFRNSRTGEIGPTDELRRELERRGIVIVIHE